MDSRSAWNRIAGTACREARVFDALGRPWGAWGVHRHSCRHAVIPLLGTSLLDIGDHRILPLTPGEVVLLGPWVYHVHRKPYGGGLTLLLCRTGAVAEVELWQGEGVWYGDLPWSRVHRHVEDLAAARTPAGRRAAGDRLLRALAAAEPTRRSLPPAVRAMCTFVWRMRNQCITAAEVLAASGLSYAVAHELFVGRFGETPKQYLLRVRLDLARHLLLAGAQPATIWREAGFASRADLSRRFRLVHGLPPLAWVRHARPYDGRVLPYG
jgi:AraC-like DNA-binding protein